MQADAAADQKYLRAALTNQYNVILVVGAAAFAAASASWVPLVVAFLGEVVWLFIGPRLVFFRGRAVALVARASCAKAIESLPPEYAERAGC